MLKLLASSQSLKLLSYPCRWPKLSELPSLYAQSGMNVQEFIAAGVKTKD